ncbi:uncharacterized protein LOC110819131 isoform X2 [Carica papaya]|uniref:uncharacterized protein LOC110819131 isoform X2 n=1 Tax=Carica papaya TaxID=3649 RepID=UPI000B8CB561|nr:uncharacterized protein LOC110819131 isoform X2 [Carica papaya]
MGKSLPCTTRLHEFSRIVSFDKPPRAERAKPISRNGVSVKEAGRTSGVRVDPGRAKQKGMEGKVPLSAVVSDCVKRWFEETLKEARAGDIAMQVLVGQMYNTGYGVTRDTQKIELQKAVLQFGKQAINIQVIMPVNQIPMALRKMENKLKM